MVSVDLSWVSEALTIVEDEGACILVTQSRVQGSAPREEGVKMLVANGLRWGTIGGGRLENQIIAQSNALLERADLNSLIQDYPLGPLLAQCCGGHVRILLERLSRQDLGWLDQIRSQLEKRGNGYLKTDISGAQPRKQIVDDVGFAFKPDRTCEFANADGSIIEEARPSATQCNVMYERLADRAQTVNILGAGHVGKALAHVLSISDFDVRLYDSRQEALLYKTAIQVRELGDVAAWSKSQMPGAMNIIVTHCHDLDYELIRSISTRGDFAYCGLIGSKTKRARFLKRLKDEKIPSEIIGRLTCPIGSPKMSGKTPSGIAYSVASELMGLRQRSVAMSNVAVSEGRKGE